MSKTIVIVHDYITQRGGAERVVLALLRTFPEAELVTSLYEPQATFPEFARYNVHPLWSDRISAFRHNHTLAYPVLPLVFSRAIKNADAVICSSSGWAHAVRTGSIPKLVYCHNPARWLYQPDDYFSDRSSLVRMGHRAISTPLRAWDQAAAGTADRYLANSTGVAARILRVYGLTASVVHPPVMIDASGLQVPIPSVEPGFFLTLNRPRGYKNARAIAQAIMAHPTARAVFVGAEPGPETNSRIQHFADLPDAQIRWLYASCTALVAASSEDFGLTPLEANAFGKPAIALRAGGYLDSVIDGTTGYFFNTADPDKIKDAIDRILHSPLAPGPMIGHAVRFSHSVFGEAIKSHISCIV